VTPPVRVGPAPVDSPPGPGARAGRGIPPAAGPGFRRSHRDGHGRWRTDSESWTVSLSLSRAPGPPGPAESKSGDRAVASDRGSDDPGDCPITGPAALCQLSDDSRSSLSEPLAQSDEYFYHDVTGHVAFLRIPWLRILLVAWRRLSWIAYLNLNGDS
jgi:hypothetical protein